jgi:hypothetical protein
MDTQSGIHKRNANPVDDPVCDQNSISDQQQAAMPIPLDQSRKLTGSAPAKYKLAGCVKLPNASHQSSFAFKRDREAEVNPGWYGQNLIGH